jgi:hypothetical protein
MGRNKSINVRSIGPAPSSNVGEDRTVAWESAWELAWEVAWNLSRAEESIVHAVRMVIFVTAFQHFSE